MKIIRMNNSLVNISFRIKPEMPDDIKNLILKHFTDYKNIPSNLEEKYSEILNLRIIKPYHYNSENIYNENVCVKLLPKDKDSIKKFFNFIGKYVLNNVSSVGICYNKNNVYYYYINEMNKIKCQKIIVGKMMMKLLERNYE